MEWRSEQSATFSSWSRAGISWAGIKGLRLNWELWFKLFLAESYLVQSVWLVLWKLHEYADDELQFSKNCKQVRNTWFTTNW